MKKLFVFSILLYLSLPIAFSQQSGNTLKPSLKYGKPSKEELTLTSYAADTTATAIYLLHQGKSHFEYRDGFQLVTEHWVRIKILKPQGVSYADVSIPYYSPSDKDEGQERASGVEGCSYNMEKGECIKTSLKRDLISDERVNQYHRLLKFSLPAVKVGTVIEYYYKLYSDYFAHIDNWMMQEEIPVLYNQYKITIPNVFIYNIELRGKDYIESKEKESSMHATTTATSGLARRAEDFSVSARELTFTSQNLPAIRQDESYCWCPEDYKIQISFDLEGTNFPGEQYKPLSQKWEDVDKLLSKPEDEQFGKHLSMINPYREDTKKMYSSGMNFNEKVITAFRVLKDKLAWNGKYQLYSRELTKVIEAGTGSNADLNFILISILKDLGIDASPVVLSRRSTGMLPFNFPSLQKLNTFVLAIYNPDTQKYVYLDSSMDIPAFNTLPLDLCVNQARILAAREPEEKKWVDLMNLFDNKVFMNINATIQGEQIKGHRTTQLQGQQAVEYQKHLKQEEEKPKQETPTFASETSNKERIIISNLKTEHAEDGFARIKEDFDFTMEAEKTGERLYVNPMLFPQLNKNPFIQAERALPIEFNYPYTLYLICTLTLPEGYEVEEMPQSKIVKTEDGNLQCKYMIEKSENKVNLHYAFNMKAFMFAPEQYKQLQEIWTKVIEKNQALIVLKKL